MLITLSSQSTTASLASNLASSAPSTSLKIRVNQIAVHRIATASSLLLLLSLQLLNNIQVSIHSPFKSDALFYILKMRKNSSECLYAEHHQNVYLYVFFLFAFLHNIRSRVLFFQLLLSVIYAQQIVFLFKHNKQV